MLGRTAAALLTASLLASTAALAQPVTPGTGVQASQAWSRATPPGADTAAIYVILKAPTTDRLIGATTPEAKKAEIHQITMAGNVRVMRAMRSGLPLPPGQPVSLQPGGYHIMLTGLTNPLKLGDTFPIHLAFQTSPAIDLVARVASIGVSEPPAAGNDLR